MLKPLALYTIFNDSVYIFHIFAISLVPSMPSPDIGVEMVDNGL